MSFHADMMDNDPAGHHRPRPRPILASSLQATS